ncbi:MAG: SEC-C metal-binding domain-containing protein [Gammaproteobacteria bacterium]|nr:SEC-C metal-binding domain-containing protein [Gammaproteobacteria bacterium]
MRKIGRNAPCPCGSGKKYKKCCLKSATASLGSLGWRKLRRAEEDISAKLARQLSKYYGEDAFSKALDAFVIYTNDPDDEGLEIDLEAFFPPWFLYNWIPHNDGVDESEHIPEMPIARYCLQKEGSQFTAYEQRFIMEACSQPFSFFMVTDVVPGKSVSLRDLIIEREITVHERIASTTLEKGSIIFTRVLKLDEDAIMVGCASTVIPASFVNEFIAIREHIQSVSGGHPDQDLLHKYDYDFRQRYFDIRDDLFNPTLPQLANTDGDPLQPTKLYYSLGCSPQEALEALATLSLAPDAEELQAEGICNKTGELVRIEFPWLKKGNQQHNWDNTVMGHIVIDNAQLTIDVNSQQRADAIKRKITRRLGKRATYQNAVIESIEKMLEEHENGTRESAPTDALTNEELQNLPEVQQYLQEMSVQHWRTWLDTTLPALNGETPREAAKHPTGRERLEALLLSFEHYNQGPELFRPNVNTLRESLGLVSS